MRKLKEGALAAQKDSGESSVERLNWNGSNEGFKPEQSLQIRNESNV